MAKKPAEVVALDPKTMNWSGYKPVAMLRLEPAELASRYGLTFRENHDDLDYLVESSFRGPRGHIFALVRHVGSPASGTELLVKAESPAEIRSQLREAMGVLGLTKTDLPWVIPTATTKTTAARKKVTKKKAAAKKSKLVNRYLKVVDKR